MGRRQSLRILFLVGCVILFCGASERASVQAEDETVQLPEGFALTVIASGFRFGTDMVFLPNDDILVTEKGSGAGTAGLARVRLVRNGVLEPTAVVTVSVSTPSEAGLTGIALDPGFTENGYFYLWYATGEKATGWSGTTVNRLARFTFDAATGSADPASELILLDNVQWSVAHNGGGMLFGDDGLFYLSIGDAERPQLVQARQALNGAVVRLQMTEQGYAIPADNPFLAEPQTPPEVYAYGLRNPFRMTKRLRDGAVFLADVGEAKWEELDRLAAGANYGWAVREGPCPRGQLQPCDPAPAAYTEPLLAYPHPPDAGGAITGLAFYEGAQFPPVYQGKLFFADYDQRYIALATIDESTTASLQPRAPISFTIEPFALDIGGVVDLAYYKENLYVLNASTASLEMIHYVGGENRIPSAVLTVEPALGQPPLTVTLSGAASSDADDIVLRYHWDWGDGEPPAVTTTAVVTHTYNAEGTYHARLQVIDVRGGESAVAEQLVTVYAGDNPTIEFDNLSAPGRTLYHAGDQIRYRVEREAGMADLDPDAPFTWRIDLHHNDHVHPELTDFVATEGTLSIPTSNHGGDWRLWYRFSVTMKTASGQEVQVMRELRPALATTTVMLQAGSVQLTDTVLIDTIARPAPYSFKAIVGTPYEIVAPAMITPTQPIYLFDHWETSVGETAGQELYFAPHDLALTIPVTDTTYSAHYLAQPTILWLPTIQRQ